MTDDPGRHIADDGRLVLHWPPAGPYAALWARTDAAIPDADKEAALSLLMAWSEQNSTLVAYQDDDGAWHHIDWQEPHRWSG